MSRLEQWFIEKERNRLYGLIYEDNRFADGHFVRTSPVIETSDFVNGVPTRAKTRSGTIYTLGTKMKEEEVKDGI